MCQEELYHFNGLCFNKNLIPEGEIAISIEECAKIRQERELCTTIISN